MVCRSIAFNLTVGPKIYKLKSPDIGVRLELWIVPRFFLCLSCMKHIFQTSGSLSLYLKIKSSKAPVPSTFEARRKPSVLCRALAKRKEAILISYFAPCCPSVPSCLRNFVRVLAVWGKAEVSSCKKMNCGYLSVANWFYLGTDMVHRYLFKVIRCIRNGFPRCCKSHVPSRGFGAKSGTVVGLGFRQSFVNADWAYENLMIEWMAVMKLWKTCHVWVEILHWLYLPWKFKQYIEVGLCLWEKGDKLQQSSCHYVFLSFYLW